MSAVDVLAVLLEDYVDASIERQWYEDAKERAERSEQARAAVAELMEAAKESQAAWESFYANDGENGSTIRLSAAFHREAAALARCGK